MEPIAWNTREQPGVGIGAAIGDYVIEEHLGHGSEGDVFLARDSLLGRRVAIKTLRPSAAEATHGVEEARLMVSVEHPNVVRVYHAQRYKEIWVVVFEYIDAGSLYSQVQRMGPLAPVQALEYLAQAAAGLSYAHEIGIVHRDVKPHNLLLNRQGQVKLADFGLALDARGATHSGAGAGVGTPAFLAPELWSKGAASPASDVYSLGACLYFLLTGRVPFPFSNPEQLERAHLKLIPKLPPDIPIGVKQMLLAMMAKDPASRPASDGQLSRELLSLARDPNRPRRATQSSRPREIVSPFVDGGQEHALEFALSRGPDAPYLDRLVAALQSGQSAIALCEAQPGSTADLLLRIALARCAPSTQIILRVPLASPTANLNDLLRQKSEATRLASLWPRAAERPSASVPAQVGRRIVEVRASVGLSPVQAGDLSSFIHAAASDITTVVVLSSADPACPIDLSPLAGVPVLELPRPDAHFGDFVERARLWTSAATGGRWDFSVDALRMLRHLCRERGCVWHDLIRDSLLLAAGARLPLVTSWAVSAAHGQASSAGVNAAIPSEWRAPPRRWPTPPALGLLGDLRDALDAELAAQGCCPVLPVLARPARTVREPCRS